MSNPTPILNNINAFDATKGTTISFNIIGGTDIVRSNIVYIYDLSTNDLICTHLYISTESIHELPPNTDSSIVYADGKSSADFVNNKNYYLQIQTFTNTAGTAGGSGMSVAKTFWCLFNPALSVNTIPAAISTTSYNVGATYTTNITDVTIPVTNIIQQYKFDLYTATGTLVQTSGNIIGSGEQEGTSTTYNITYNFSGLVVNNSYYVIVTTTSTEGMTVSAQSNTFTVSVDTPTVGGAIVNNNACDGYISVVSNLSDEYGGSASGEMASFETDSVNNVSSLKVNMEPIQDLHGYDHPWVGGAGVNLVDSDILINDTYNKYNIPNPLKNGQTYTYSVYGDNTFGYGLFAGHTNTAVPQPNIPVVNRYVFAGNHVTFTAPDDIEEWEYLFLGGSANGAGSKEIQVQIEKGTVANPTYHPYSNICPISGHTECVTERCGVNLFDADTILTDVGFTRQADGLWYKASLNGLLGIKIWENSLGYDGDVCISYKYKYANGSGSAGLRFKFVYADGGAVTDYPTMATSLTERVFTSAAGSYHGKVVAIEFDFGTASNSTWLSDVQIELGSTATDYHAYNGQTYTQEIEATYTPTVQENEPYQFKQTGDVGGDRESIELVGGSVAWNQLVRNGDFSTESNWIASNATKSISSGICTFTATAQNGNICTSNPSRIFPSTVNNHKYFALAEVKLTTATTDVVLRLNGGYREVKTAFNTNWQTLATVYNLANSDNGYVQIIDKRTSGWDSVQVKTIMLVDLTQMFGSTIADYIYSLEQAHAGAGVAWFRQYFPKDYYPYDPGTLRSVEGVSAHETVGFNQWDEEWEVGTINSQGQNATGTSTIRSKNYIPILPNTVYYITNVMSAVFWYDADKNLISLNYSGGVKTSPADARYMRFYSSTEYGNTYNNDICINLSDPSRNGEYEPYQKHTYPLDSSLTLRGVPKLVDGKLAFDGDVYPPSGEVDRRYGLVDLGTLTWNAPNASGRASSTSDIGAKPAVNGDYVNLVSTYQAITPQEWYNASKNGVTICGAGYGGDGRVGVVNSSFIGKTAAEITTAMSGVYLVYEKATPTTETAEPFTNPQVVDNGGTEAYVTTGIVPVGHDSEYLTRDVFGGTLDLVTGVLTVDRAMVTLDGSDHAFFNEVSTTQTAEGSLYVAFINSTRSGIKYGGVCSSDKYEWINASNSSLHRGQFNSVGSYTRFCIVDQTINTLAKWDAWLAQNPLQLCYELAQPQTYQLTPHQIQTLVGQNNIWSDAGDVDVTFNLPISNLLVKRQDASDVSGDWLTLYSQPITQASDMNFTFIDFLNQHGKTYRYALVPLLTQQQGDIDVEIEGGYTVSDDVLSVFDGVFIANSNGSQKLKAATEYGDLETNQDVGVLTTIGNKYPFVVSNSNLNYHSGSISALIVPSDFYTSGDLDRLSIVERREAIEKFLTDKTAKILKDWNGNIWLITFVENVEVGFVDDYGMGLGTLSAKWVEIGDVNDQTDLKQTGLI